MISCVRLVDLRPVARNLLSKQCFAVRSCAPGGVLIHFDDSSEDHWAVEWFSDPACKVSYNRLYLRDGTIVQITPSMSSCAWHAGVCLTKNANSYYYGLSAATNNKVPVDAKQLDNMIADTVSIFKFHGWTAADVHARIKGHEEEACFANRKLGRKIDPTGTHPEAPILSLPAFRQAVAERLA